MKSRIPYTQPSITELEVRYATNVAANGWVERRIVFSRHLIATA